MPIVLKSRSLNLLEPSGSVQACNGIAFPFITYSECVSVALVIQHAMRMRRIILSSVTGLAVQNFSAISHKRYDLRENVLKTKRVFRVCLQLLSETFLILR